MEYLRDYSETGLTIREALLEESDRLKAQSTRPVVLGARPPCIRWADKQVTTVDLMEVPTSGRLRLEFVSSNTDVCQGVDIRMSGGCILDSGSLVPLLRTWLDERFEDWVEYDYLAEDGLLRSWNVYQVQRGSGPQEALIEEARTENAGMWIEAINDTDHICHCSHGDSTPPDFENLVYRILVTEFSLD